MTEDLTARFTFIGGEIAAKLLLPGPRTAFLSLILWSSEDYWTLLVPGQALLKSTDFPSGELETWLGGSPLLASLRSADLHHRVLTLRDAIGAAVYAFEGDKERHLEHIADPICARWTGSVPELTHEA